MFTRASSDRKLLSRDELSSGRRLWSAIPGLKSLGTLARNRTALFAVAWRLAVWSKYCRRITGSFLLTLSMRLCKQSIV